MEVTKCEDFYGFIKFVDYLGTLEHKIVNGNRLLHSLMLYSTFSTNTSFFVDFCQES